MPAYKVKVTPANGQSLTYYLDAGTFLPIKTSLRIEAGERYMEIERLFSNFKKVNGITFAHSVENKNSGDFSGTSRDDYDKIAVNASIDESLFKVPTAEMIAAITRDITLKGKLETIKPNGVTVLRADQKSPDQPWDSVQIC